VYPQGEDRTEGPGLQVPLQYRLFTPESQWQSRGKTAQLTGGGLNNVPGRPCIYMGRPCTLRWGSRLRQQQLGKVVPVKELPQIPQLQPATQYALKLAGHAGERASVS
jgi:hypothetical protein